MAENIQLFKKNIEETDGIVGADERERTAIDCLSPIVNKLPKDRLEKLISEIQDVLRRQELDHSAVRAICKKKLAELQDAIDAEKSISDSISEKFKSVTAIGEKILDTSRLGRGADEAAVNAQVMLSRATWKTPSEHKLLTYEGGWNFAVTITEFEAKIRNTPIEKLSSRGLANYLLYLAEYRPDGLEQKSLESSIGRDKLLRLAILWGHDKWADQAGTTLAQKFLSEDPKFGSIARARLDRSLKDIYGEQRVLVERAKKAGTFEYTEKMLQEMFPEVNIEGIGKDLDSAKDLTDVFGRLNNRGLKITQEADVQRILDAIQTDSEQQAKVAELENSVSPIDGESTLDRFAKPFRRAKERAGRVFRKVNTATVRLVDLTREQVEHLSDAIASDDEQDEEKLALFEWLENHGKILQKREQAEQAEAAKKSKQTTTAIQDMNAGKVSATETRKTIEAATKIHKEEKQLTAKLEQQRKSLPSGAPELKETIEQIKRNASRKLAFETWGLQKLAEYDARRWIDTNKANEEKNPSKADVEQTNATLENIRESRSSGYRIPFGAIDRGEVFTRPLDPKNHDPDSSVTIWSVDTHTYVVDVYSSTMNVPRDSVGTYLASLRYLERIWLGYILRHMSQEELHHLLRGLSREDGMLAINNTNGFDKREKLAVLRAFGRLLEIGEFQTVDDGESKFAQFAFSGRSIAEILRDKKIIQDEILRPTVLAEKMGVNPELVRSV